MPNIEVPIQDVTVEAFRIPTQGTESDGTLEWNSTTLVLVRATAGGMTGIGFTYADTAAAQLVQGKLSEVVKGQDVMGVPGLWTRMVQSIRNLGRPGISSMAIAAVDTALWDLKARILDLPLATLLGAARNSVPVYGSGGFTSYSTSELQKQLGDWVEAGIPRVKMKIGRNPQADIARVRDARQAIGPDAELFVDANGAYARKQALAQAERFVEEGVCWFEEPVSSDDLEGLRLMRDRAPAGMEIAAGEYGYDAFYFRRMLEAGAVDVLQADASRCAGVTGFLQVAALADAFGLPLSAHTAPSLHLHPCCAAPRIRPLEYFHDHVRIERMLFDGARVPSNGELTPDSSRPGLGLEFKAPDARQYAIDFRTGKEPAKR